MTLCAGESVNRKCMGGLYFHHSVILLPTGQRILQYCSDVLETVVLVNPSEETAVSEVNSISHTYFKQNRMSWNIYVHNVKSLNVFCSCMLKVSPSFIKTCILLPENQDLAVCLHLSSVSYYTFQPPEHPTP